MSGERVIIVHLRRPGRNDRRSDPFYEFGSFGCTGCHARNLLHPAAADELAGARFAFAQGGPLGFRLVLLTPPARVKKYTNLIELRWGKVLPFRYDCAPVLVDANGDSAFPCLRRTLDGRGRKTLVGQFSSDFRSRRRPLDPIVGDELARVFDRMRGRATAGELTRSYVDTLPYALRKEDKTRWRTLLDLRAKADGKGTTPPRGRCR